MAMIVKNNMQALNTLNTLNSNTNALTNSLKKVSSGMKINSAQDDASGYAISERMRVQIRSLDQAKANTNSGNSLLKVAEGAVSSTVDILKTLKEKVINAANDTNTDEDRATIQKELNQSIDQINDNASVTFNGKFLVDGTHNKKTTATTTALTNQSLDVGTATNAAISTLKNRNGDSLNIQSTDTVTVSYTKNGVTHTCSMTVSDNTLSGIFEKMTQANGTKFSADLQFSSASSQIALKDGSGNVVRTASGQSALTVTAAKSGIAGQIAGLSISITDNQGNARKAANSALDAFSETVRAVNESADNSIHLQIGVKANQTINVGMTDMRAIALGLQGKNGETLNVGTREKANAAITVLDNAIQKALDQQTSIGAAESRLDYTAANLTTASENVTNAESTIRDADMAKEMTEYTKNNVLMQAAQSMLAQANQNSSNVLSLLQ